jgi:hypothetical protein
MARVLPILRSNCLSSHVLRASYIPELSCIVLQLNKRSEVLKKEERKGKKQKRINIKDKIRFVTPKRYDIEQNVSISPIMFKS